MLKKSLISLLLGLVFVTHASATIEVICNQREQNGDQMLSLSIEKAVLPEAQLKASVHQSREGKVIRKAWPVNRTVFNSQRSSLPESVRYSEEGQGSIDFLLDINTSKKSEYNVYPARLHIKIENLKIEENLICQFYYQQPEMF